MANGKISFNCPGCGREFNVEARLKGRKIRCSQCKRLSPIPSSTPKKRLKTRVAAPSPNNDGEATADSSAQPESPPQPVTEPSPPEPEAVPPEAESVSPEPEAVPPEEESESEPLSSKPEPKQATTASPARIRIKPKRPKTEAPPDEGTAAETSQPDEAQPSPENTPPPETQASTNTTHPADAEPPPESVSAPESAPSATLPDEEDTTAELREQLAQAKQALAEMNTRSEQDERAYSRTLTKLSAQLDEATHERDQMVAELNDMRQQKQQLENNTSRQHAQFQATLQAAKQAVDQYCEAQLTGMQALRQKLKQLSGDKT